MTHDTSVQSHRFHWNLSFGTPLFKGHLHSGNKNFGPWMLTFLSLHLLPLLKGHLSGGALKGRLGRGVPPKPSKSPNPIENKSAVDRFVLLWQLTEIHWGKQLSEDLTTEEVATVLRFFFLVATSVTTATPGRWFCTMTSVKTWYARSPILIERLARHADILWDIHVCSRVLCKSKLHGKNPSVELITHF